MRYLLFWHIHEHEMRARSETWHEEVAEFLSRFEDELGAQSELDWSQVLAPESQAEVVGPGNRRESGVYNEHGKPVVRLWMIRVDDPTRASEIAGRLAGELDTWIEVREVYEGAHRP